MRSPSLCLALLVALASPARAETPVKNGFTLEPSRVPPEETPVQLVLSEDQELIAKTAIDFMQEKSPVSRMRALRDSGDETGFSKSLWKEI